MNGCRPSSEQRRRVEQLIDEYRVALHDSMDDLTEEEARRRLVPSETTLLGLVEHATFVEGVWRDQVISGRSHADIGIPATVDGSFSNPDAEPGVHHPPGTPSRRYHPAGS